MPTNPTRSETLVHGDGDVTAVERQQRDHVEDGHEDVDADEQQQQLGEAVVLRQLPCDAGGADHLDGPVAVGRGRALAGLAHDLIGVVLEPVGGEERPQRLDGEHGAVAEAPHRLVEPTDGPDALVVDL